MMRPSEASELRLLVAIPALNESATITNVISGIPRWIPGIAHVDVLVVDDGSSDDTGTLARAAGADVMRHASPRGVGAAFRSALDQAIERGVDILLSIDGDGQFDPRDIPTLIAPLVKDEADFVTASRFLDPDLEPEMPTVKRWGNRQVSRLISSLSGRRFADVSCGMRAYNRRALLNLNLMGRFTYTQEVFLNLTSKDMRIVEVPVAVRGEREFGKSRVASNLWTYALRSSGIIFRAYRDYHPLRFFGSIALVLLALSGVLAGFLACHFLLTGSLTPHKWAGFSASILAALASLVGVLAVLGDLLKRHREYLEEILRFHRAALGRSDAPSARPTTGMPVLRLDSYQDPEQIAKLLGGFSGRILLACRGEPPEELVEELRAAGFKVLLPGRRLESWDHIDLLLLGSA